ncbi:hypothetical protein MHB65_22230 [Lysinibacillus sp. FSL K6-0075]|uniref:hypothetical protein n=1 Tax=Lysinibacillus sp. FSL K6-0075 TaxID=2921415 RepID=UPI003158D2E9
MNNSFPRINEEVTAILNKSKEEPAFEGTVLEGKERRYTIINERDVEKYLSMGEQQDLAIVLDRMLGNIEHGREKDGKKQFNSYVVINTDEPWIDEIIEVMKRNGAWD